MKQTRMTMKTFWVYLMCLLALPAASFAQESFLQKLKTMPSVSEVKPLENSEQFAEKYVISFKQPVDHKHPKLGHFLQRVIVGHVDYNRPTIIVTEGYGAAYALRPGYREELSRLFNANMIFVEHRYFLESTPKSKDWKYLTAENSADDLHAVTTAFKSLYKGKWVSTGISKGGQTALLYRAFYPEDVDVSVPYVAPLCYAQEDGRHEPFLKQVSTADARRQIEDFQLEVLKRKSALMPAFEQWCKERDYAFRAPLAEIFDYCVLEYSFSIWQWGTSLSEIPATSASDDVLFDHLMSISEPSYFQKDSPNASFFVQAARELGYYGYDIEPFKPYLSIQSSKHYLSRLMLPKELQNMPFDKALSLRIVKFLKSSDPRMIFIYGQNDPWTAAGVTWLKDKTNIHVFIQPGGSHLARISTLPEAMQSEALQLLKQWLEE